MALVTSQFKLAGLLLFLSVFRATQAVILPNRLQLVGLNFMSPLKAEADPVEDVPYQLTINEGAAINTKLNSKSHLTVNLNRAISVDIQVTIKVLSGSNLITFDTSLGNSSSSTASTTIKYPANTFGDRVVNFHTGNAAGHAEVVCSVDQQPKDNKIDDSSAYISVNIGRSDFVDGLILIVGWMYFVAWSISFYFQVILNYQRKSVVGLNFDFLALNLLGFACYTIYNYSLMFSRQVRKEYYERNTYSRIPVEYNDLFFAAHALIITLVTVTQCFIYERGQQTVSIAAGSFIATTSTAGVVLLVISFFHKIKILDVVLYLSYVKLAVTLIKYTPQAYMNYKRKATTGWSIHNILLDFTGGVLSISQMFFLAYNYDDWISIFSNLTKFGLGFFSICFDCLFLVQHYVLYQQVGEFEVSTDTIPSPVISQSIRSYSSIPPQVVEQASEQSNVLPLMRPSGEPEA